MVSTIIGLNLMYRYIYFGAAEIPDSFLHVITNPLTTLRRLAFVILRLIIYCIINIHISKVLALRHSEQPDLLTLQQTPNEPSYFLFLLAVAYRLLVPARGVVLP